MMGRQNIISWKKFVVVGFAFLACSKERDEDKVAIKDGIYESLADSLFEAVHTSSDLLNAIKDRERKFRNTDLPDSVKSNTYDANNSMRLKVEAELEINKRRYFEITGIEWPDRANLVDDSL